MSSPRLTSADPIRPVQPAPPRRTRWLRAPLVLVVILGALPTTQCLRRDEVECEEAVASLTDCCPGFDPKQIDCTFDPGCTRPTYPSLSPAESECILDMSCGSLQTMNVCKRLLARNVAEKASMSSPEADAGVGAEVCR